MSNNTEFNVWGTEKSPFSRAVQVLIFIHAVVKALPIQDYEEHKKVMKK